MNAVAPLSTIAVADASATAVSKLTGGGLVRQLGLDIQTIVYRAPAPHETHRWRRHVIGGVAYGFAQPITFTPYAAAQPCSARCRFCSENLRDAVGTKSSSARRPGSEYFAHLRRSLRELEGLPLGYSLSGLETTDDQRWMERILDLLRAHAERSPVTERVLYTNVRYAHARRAVSDVEGIQINTDVDRSLLR